MAKKRAGGNTKNGRDSQSKRLGVKIFGGAKVFPGNIIIRQNGMKIKPGKGVKIGRDYTIYSTKEGNVRFKKSNKKYVFID